jgi:uncharacterized protein
VTEISEIKSEEMLIPAIRAHLANKLLREGFHVREIANALNVSQPAVTQYLKGKRGKSSYTLNRVDEIVDPLAEKLAKRIRSDLGGVETVDILETARQLMVINKGGTTVAKGTDQPERNRESVKLLRERLQLELTAAEKYLELANTTSDEHTKLLLRLIASDSLKHGDIVSQIMSWLEIQGREVEFQTPDHAVLEQMITLEDSANEVNLRKSIKTAHPVARLLLEWIDTDEEKHEKIVTKILRLSKRTRIHRATGT